MSKFLRTAAEVVGVIVAVAAAIPSGGTSLLAAGLGVSTATASLVALGTEVAVMGLEALTAPKPPKAVGNPMAWQSDPQAGLPIIFGRAYTGGKIFYRDTWGGKDLPNETIKTAYSIGPIKAFEGFYVDGALTTITGTTANIPNAGRLDVVTQRGLQPEPLALGGLGPPGWTASSKCSGLAASSITLIYDTKGKKTMTTEPQCGFVVQGVRVYDPRKDSTYPGGSGAQRATDETSWSYDGFDNPYLAGLTWLIGFRDNGKLVAGVGLPISAILVEQFVEGANVADANGWKLGGELDSTDDKWPRLKDLLQAGGGEPMHIGARIGCLINAPRVSLATISIGDVIGDASVQATQSLRSRINAVVPRYMAEQSLTIADGSGNLRTTVTWGLVAGSPVVVQDYVTFDGKQRQKQIDYTFVQNLTQSQQLARYDIENAREFGPITLPLKLRWMGYRPGDVVTANLPELGLNGQDILLLQRELSPQDMTVTMTARSETAGKHPYALGQTGTPPATPSVTGPPLIPIPGEDAWALVGGTLTSDNGTTVPVLQVIGAADSSVIDAVVFEYRLSQTSDAPPGPWIAASTQPPSIELLNIVGVRDQTAYDVSVSYRMAAGTGDPLILGPAVAGQTSVPYQTGVTGPKPPVDADNTATVFLSLGRAPEAVIGDLDINAQAIIEQGLRQDDAQIVLDARTFIDGQPVAGVFQAFRNEQIDTNAALESSLTLLGAKTPDGTAWNLNLDGVRVSPDQTLAEKFTEIGVATGTVTATVETLQTVVLGPTGSATARAVLSLDVNGHVSGYTATNDGTTSSFYIVASEFGVVDPGGGTPFIPFQIIEGVVKMHTVEIDTLKTNTAVIPVRGSATSPVVGAAPATDASPAATTAGAAVVLTVAVEMTAPGWIEVQAWGQQGYSAAAAYGLQIFVQRNTDPSTQIPEATTGAPSGLVVPAISIQGAYFAATAGTYTVRMYWNAHSGLTLNQRSLFAKGFQFTE